MKVIVALALLASMPFSAAAGDRSVDLRSSEALAQLQAENPAHFAKIRQILAGLQEQPQRVEGDWLQVNFDASAVNLQRDLIKTSYPPKQLLTFRLDEVRYTLYVSRSDLTPRVMPAK